MCITGFVTQSRAFGLPEALVGAVALQAAPTSPSPRGLAHGRARATIRYHIRTRHFGITSIYLHAHACTSCACIFGVGCHFYFRLFTKAKSLGKSWSLKFGIPVEHADRKELHMLFLSCMCKTLELLYKRSASTWETKI